MTLKPGWNSSRASVLLPLMRIDKFLWCVRLYKTRSKASEAVRKERVLLDDQQVKPSREIGTGAKITSKKQGVAYQYRILDFPKSRVSAKLVPEFLKDVTPAEEIQKREFLGMMRQHGRKKGEGRPTKKERRDLDDFKDVPPDL